MIIKGRSILDKCQQQRQPPRDSIESKTAIQLNLLAQPNPEDRPSQAQQQCHIVMNDFTAQKHQSQDLSSQLEAKMKQSDPM